MKTLVIACFFGCTGSALAVVPSPIQVVGRKAEMTIFALDETTAMDALTADAAKLGGYMKLRTPTRLIVRIPTETFDAFIAKASALGTVGERKLSTDDLTDVRRTTRAELASRELMLKDYLAILSQAKTRDDLVEIQSATGTMIQEIEARRGTLRVMDNDAKYALVDMSFQKRDRRPLQSNRETSFAWLRTVDVQQLLSDFQRGEP